MKRWWLLSSLLFPLLLLCGFNAPYQLTVNPTGMAPQITGISVNPGSFVIPGTYSGTLSITCSAVCPANTPSYSLFTNTTDGCTSNGNQYFNPISGNVLNSNGVLTIVQNYWPCVQVTMSGVSNSGFFAFVSVNGVAGQPSITGVSASPSTFNVPGSYSGTLTATCSDTCPNNGTFALNTTPNACAAANSAGVAVSGTTMTLPSETTAGLYYACVNVAMNGTSNSGSPQLVTVTGNSTAVQITGVMVSPNSCTIVSPATTCNFSGALTAVCSGPCPGTANFALSGGGGGGGTGIQPYGNIPCPGGCTWNNTFNADFRVANSSIIDQTTSVTAALFRAPPDGTTNGDSQNPDPSQPPITACWSGGLDTTHLPGYIALHATGTAAWETAGNQSCPLWAKVSTNGTPPGCGNGWYTVPAPCAITKPTLWEYSSLEAVNQLDQYTIGGVDQSATQGNPAGCGSLTYFGESRGNNFHAYNGFSTWNASCAAAWVRGTPVFQSDDAHHVATVVFDPQTGWLAYWDGALTYQGDPDQCAGGVPCVENQFSWWVMEVAISANCGGPCGPGGSWIIDYARAYTGQ